MSAPLSAQGRVEILVAHVGGGGRAGDGSSEGVESNDVHCQVPCGIFDDPRMVGSLREHSATARKAVAQVNELSSAAGGGGVRGLQQMSRWVGAKEDHCGKIIALVSEYCLCQRVARDAFAMVEEDFEGALRVHHAVLVAAMKVKQTTDLAACDALDHAVADMCAMYLPAV